SSARRAEPRQARQSRAHSPRRASSERVAKPELCARAADTCRASDIRLHPGGQRVAPDEIGLAGERGEYLTFVGRERRLAGDCRERTALDNHRRIDQREQRRLDLRVLPLEGRAGAHTTLDANLAAILEILRLRRSVPDQ